LPPANTHLTAARGLAGVQPFLGVLVVRCSQLYTGKRGMIEASEPSALARLGVAARRWEHDVKGVGNGYWRVVGSTQELIDKAIALGQQWLKGIGYARSLVAKAD
jgi:hypothetical protein